MPASRSHLTTEAGDQQYVAGDVVPVRDVMSVCLIDAASLEAAGKELMRAVPWASARIVGR